MMHMLLGPCRWERLPLLLVGTYLVLCWALLVVVDVLNLGGLGDRFYELTGFEGTWVALFREASLTEMFQWLLLLGAALGAACLAGRLSVGDPPPTVQRQVRFWGLMGVAFGLMLIEDAGNPRHALANLAVRVGGDDAVRPAVELAYFGLLAAVPLTALVFFGRDMLRMAGVRGYMIGGFAVYGAIALASGTGKIGEWYEHGGRWIHQSLLGGGLRGFHTLERPMEFWLMDWAVEESIELLGAALFAGAVLAFWRRSVRHRLNADQPVG